MRFKQYCLWLIGLVILPAWASEERIEIKQFYIKPKLCIVEKDVSCKRYFVFGWQLTKQQKACVFRAVQASPIRCVSGQSQTEFELPLDVKNTESFTLRVEDSSVERKIEVRELGRDVRQGTRHLWSVF